jgi:hypothetical protein
VRGAISDDRLYRDQVTSPNDTSGPEHFLLARDPPVEEITDEKVIEKMIRSLDQ